MTKIPRKIKPISLGEFVRYIKVKEFTPRIYFPIIGGRTKEFSFDHATKTMLVYKEDLFKPIYPSQEGITITSKNVKKIFRQAIKILKKRDGVCPACHAELPPRKRK